MAGAHAAKKKPAKAETAPRSKKPWIIAGVIVAVLAIGAGAFAVVTATKNSSSQASGASHLPKFAVLDASPSNASTVDSNASIRVALSNPIASSSPMPTITPAIPGSWEKLSATTLEYVQQAPFAPGQAVTVTIPGGSAGMKSVNGAHLVSDVKTSFQVAPLSMTRVQQLLAQLGYLPVTFTPSVPVTTSTVSTADVPGTFSLRWSNLPATLTSQWQPGVNNVVTKGAIMRFEDVHGMKTDGVAGPTVWTALLADAATNKVDPDPYTYVYVSQNIPESLQLWSNGQVVYTSAVNTGVPGATTNVGTFPVYLRYKVTTMTGTNPDGSHYSDPGIPWVSYFSGGDALHGFIRPSYGTPQSDGCVEMPFANAEVVWPQTPIGTLVTVSA